MNDEHDVEWTPEERAAFQRLPRERVTDPLLKERVRERLRAHGRFRPQRRSTWLRVAAALVLFLTGALTGRLTAGTTPAGFVAATDPVLAPAERVQAAGSAYVETVAHFVTLRDSLPAGTAEQGRGAAISALRGAAEHATHLPGLDARTLEALAALRAAGGS